MSTSKRGGQKWGACPQTSIQASTVSGRKDPLGIKGVQVSRHFQSAQTRQLLGNRTVWIGY